MEILFGPFHDQFEVVTAYDGCAHGLPAPLVDAHLRYTLAWIIEIPRNADALQRLLHGEAAEPGPELPAQVALERLIRAIERGTLALLPRPRASLALQLQGPALDVVPLADLVTAPLVRCASPSSVPQVRDWKLGCKHTIDDEQRIIARHPCLMVVPGPEPQGLRSRDTTDVITVLLRDDRDGPPASITATPAGGTPVRAKDLGDRGGGYHAYEIPVEFLADKTQENPLSLAFWQAFNARTHYEITGAAAPIGVEVMYPYSWTLEFSLPPLQSYKAGSRLDQAVVLREGALASERRPASECNPEGWGPSSLRTTAGNRVAPKISLERSDGKKAEVDLFELLGDLARLASGLSSIIETIHDMVPMVGWYVDVELALFQGVLSAAWGWREHEDHRVYHWVDLFAETKILGLELEVGIGASALSFKAQVYARFEGELSVAIDAQRTSPDLVLSEDFPLKLGIVGKGGARFEAGYVFKIDGHIETGLDFGLTLQINHPGRIFGLEGKVEWTGLLVRAEVSKGRFGIACTEIYERRLADPKTVAELTFPRAQPYRPAYISDERIASTVEQVLIHGLDVRVIQSGASRFGFDDRAWPMAKIVEPLAARISGHRTLRRDVETVEGIAHAIRADLDALGKHWPRNYVEARDFEAYVDGPRLQSHLDAAVDLGLELMRSAGATP